MPAPAWARGKAGGFKPIALPIGASDPDRTKARSPLAHADRRRGPRLGRRRATRSLHWKVQDPNGSSEIKAWTLSNTNESNKVVQPRVPVARTRRPFSPPISGGRFRAPSVIPAKAGIHLLSCAFVPSCLLFETGTREGRHERREPRTECTAQAIASSVFLQTTCPTIF
jgi:hypothetical protein